MTRKDDEAAKIDKRVLKSFEFKFGKEKGGGEGGASGGITKRKDDESPAVEIWETRGIMGNADVRNERGGITIWGSKAMTTTEDNAEG